MKKVSMSAQSQGNPGMGPLQVCSNKTVPQSPPVSCVRFYTQ